MSDKDCILDCAECKNKDNCESIKKGYYFIEGCCVEEPYDYDENGYRMDSAYYQNMENYGVPYVPKEI